MSLLMRVAGIDEDERNRKIGDRKILIFVAIYTRGPRLDAIKAQINFSSGWGNYIMRIINSM